jgi:hypothetical protein
MLPLKTPEPAPCSVKLEALAGVTEVMLPLSVKVCPATVFSIIPPPPVAPLLIEILRLLLPPLAPVNWRVPTPAFCPNVMLPVPIEEVSPASAILTMLKVPKLTVVFPE